MWHLTLLNWRYFSAIKLVEELLENGIYGYEITLEYPGESLNILKMCFTLSGLGQFLLVSGLKNIISN